MNRIVTFLSNNPTLALAIDFMPESHAARIVMTDKVTGAELTRYVSAKVAFFARHELVAYELQNMKRAIEHANVAAGVG